LPVSGREDVDTSGCLFEGQLKVTGNDSGDCNVFVEILPTKCKSVETEGYFPKLFVTCSGKYFEPVRGKTYDATISELDIDCSLFRPDPYGCGLYAFPFSS